MHYEAELIMPSCLIYCQNVCVNSPDLMAVKNKILLDVAVVVKNDTSYTRMLVDVINK